MADNRPLPDLPDHVVPTGTLQRLVETARDYARSAAAENTHRAYAADWAAFARWSHRRGATPLPPSPELIGLYLADQAAPAKGPALTAATLERRLSGLAWGYRQRGLTLDRSDAHIAAVLAGIKRRHGAPPVRKAALEAEDIRAMVATLPHDLRGLRDRALLLVGFAGALRRSEIVGLDLGRDSSQDGTGWVEILDEGLLVSLRGKTGWREVAIGPGSTEATCPVHALTRWLHFARIQEGAIFTRISRDGARALPARLSDKHVPRLIKATAAKAALRPDLSEPERAALFSGHSLRAGLATAAETAERHVQKHLGHSSAEMTRRYQRDRDRFKTNLTKAAGL